MTLLSTYDSPIVYSGGMHFDVLMVLIIEVFTLNYLWLSGVLVKFIDVFLLRVPHGTQVKPGMSGALWPTLSKAALKTVDAVNNLDSTKGGAFRPGRKRRKVAFGWDVEKVAAPSTADESTTAIPTADTPSQLSG